MFWKKKEKKKPTFKLHELSKQEAELLTDLDGKTYCAMPDSCLGPTDDHTECNKLQQKLYGRNQPKRSESIRP